MGKRGRFEDPGSLPVTLRLAVLPWRLFGNSEIKAASRGWRAPLYDSVIATAAALAALLGSDGSGTVTQQRLSRMLLKDEREIRRSLEILTRFSLWGETAHKRRPTEWWVNVEQMALPGLDRGMVPGQLGLDRGMVPGQLGLDRGMVPGQLGLDRGMVPGQLPGRIRNSNKSNNDDDYARATGKDAPLAHPEAVSSSSSFLEKEIDGMGAADAAEIASLRSLEWVAEWLSVIPYYRKKPIENVPAFLVRAAREGWKPPVIYLNRRNADRILEAQRALEYDELRDRRPADPATVEAERNAALEKMRAAGAALRERFGKSRATA